MLEAGRKIAPAENSRYRLTLSDVDYVGPDTFPVADHKKALLTGQTLSRRLVGTLTLVDRETGQVRDRRRLTLAHVPYLTNHGTFVLDGNAEVLASQLRLDPGVYVRQKDSGEAEAHINLPPGRGVSHRLRLDQKTGVFKVDVGQAEIPAYSYFLALGASPDEIRSALGPELAAVNEAASRPQHLDRLYEKFGPRPRSGEAPLDPAGRLAKLAQALAAPVDPWVTKRTIGVGEPTYGKSHALAAAKKVLAVARGDADPDDRDSLAFARLWAPEHLIAERIERSRALADALYRASQTGTLARVQPGFFNSGIRSLFLTSGLGSNPEGVSASEYIDHGARVTKVGEGGLGRSSDAVPMSAREVSPSHFLFLDLIKTPESEGSGVDLRAAFGTQVGSDRFLRAPVIDTRSGRVVYRTPRDLADASIAFPVTYERAGPSDPVPAIVKGRPTYILKKEVRYVAPSMEQSFSPLSNLVALKSSSKPHRISMGARYIAQALPLEVPEAPLVQSGVPRQPGRSFDELYGRHMGAVFAGSDGGVVESVDSDRIVVRTPSGSRQTYELVQGLPVGRKTGLTQIPLVKAGQTVAPGQILARSNYTDEKGVAAYGANARVAFFPYARQGQAGFEDSIVVSQSFAKRLTSDHLYRHDFDTTREGVQTGKGVYRAAFASRLDPDRWDHYDDSGVIRPGSPVEPNQPLVLAIQRPAQRGFGVGRTKSAGLRDASLVWDQATPGIVQDVVSGRHGIVVTVSTKRPLEDGDKISHRFGGKGVVHVVPDHRMPTGEDGKPFDVLMSPLGVTNRINPSVASELALGKVAAHRGTPEVVHDFSDGQLNYRDALRKLQLAGLSPTETVTDPVTGRQIPGVATGHLYIMKLHHLSFDKAKARGLGSYDEAGVPQRGPSGKASRMSIGDSYALLGSGAFEVLKDARWYRGNQNEEFWLAYMAGYPPTRPAVYPHYERFLEQLRGAGIDPTRRGDAVHLFALSPQRVRELAGDREVTRPETVDVSRGDKPVPGGLFDPKLFGNPELRENRWAKITLVEPYPSPVFEEPIRRLLKLTEQEYRDVLAGRKDIRGQAGPSGIVRALREYDVSRELQRAREDFADSRKTVRDEAARRLAYLKALERTGQTPADWVVEAVPVLPPSFRPVRRQTPQSPLTVGDLNILYGELLRTNQALRELSGRVGDLGDERLAVYDAVKAVFGLGDPVNPRSRTQGVKGVLRQIFGESSKYSLVQQKLLGTPVDLSARGVVLPNPDLSMDEIGIPEGVAWDLYQPLVVRRLVRRGLPRVEALRRVSRRDAMAKTALEEELQDRPVVVTRYPVLHKYNTMAFRPRLTPGSSIHVSPIVVKGFNMDFDGDQVSLHVPLSEAAVQESFDKLLPSRNLYSISDYRSPMYLPGMEFQGGLYYASTADEQNPPVQFRTRADAIAAYRAGQLRMGTRVAILEPEASR